MKRRVCAVALLVLLALTTHSTLANETGQAIAEPELPAGDYTLDKAHASLTVRVNHLGFSHYTTRFLRFDARLQFDPGSPAQSGVTATIDPRSIETPYSNLNDVLQKTEWLDSAQFPEMSSGQRMSSLPEPRARVSRASLACVA